MPSKCWLLLLPYHCLNVPSDRDFNYSPKAPYNILFLMNKIKKKKKAKFAVKVLQKFYICSPKGTQNWQSKVNSTTFSIDSDWFEPNSKIQKAREKKITQVCLFSSFWIQVSFTLQWKIK